MESWWLDERSHAGEEHLDPGYVAAYDDKAGYDPSGDLAALRLRGLGPDSILVDIGAGTGTFAVAAARLCRAVIAVDVSPAMTSTLRRRVETLGLTNVTVLDAGFCSYEHRGDPADVVVTRNALHHLPDFWKAIALDRMASILRPGGLLRLQDLIFDFVPADAGAHIEAWMAGAVTEASAGWTAQEFALHVRGEFSTFSWLVDAMLDTAGFDVIERSFRRSAYGTYTCRRRIS